MKIRTADAARKLGLTVPAFLDAAAGLMAELREAWPEVDDGYVETPIQKLILEPRQIQAGYSSSDP
jgi:hypothetical protein